MSCVFDITKRCEDPKEFLYRQRTGRSLQKYIGDFLEPWELCYKQQQSPLQTTCHYFMPDIVINRFWRLRCRVRCTREGVIVYIQGYLIPAENAWELSMVESLTTLLERRTTRQINHWGAVEMSFDPNDKKLYLNYFYNYSTCYMDKTELQNYYPERWRGVMRRALCMCVQAYINVQQVHSRVNIGLWASPCYRYNSESKTVIDPPQSLGQFYHTTFGFGPTPNAPPEIPKSGAMVTKVESILDKCKDVFKNLKRLAPRKLRRLKKVPFRWQAPRVAHKKLVV